MIRGPLTSVGIVALVVLTTLLFAIVSTSPVGATQTEESTTEEQTTEESAEEVCSSRFCGDGIALPDAIAARAEAFAAGGGESRVIPTGSSVFAGCTWDRVLAGEELLTGRPDVASINLTGSLFDEDHWVIYCPQFDAFDAYTIFPVGDPPPAAIIQDMIADAYAQTPVVAFNPITSPDGDADIMLITQMTTFLWVDPVEWNTPVTATVTLALPGAPFSVTTTAIPRDAFWSGGDQPVQCSGSDMEPYVFGIGGDDVQPSNCSMMFLESSAVQEHTVDLEVVWDVSVACTAGACGGPLPDITTASTRPVIVGEIQAVGRANPAP